jgi:hypothetical protein
MWPSYTSMCAAIWHVADVYQHFSRACCLYRALVHAQPQSQLSCLCIMCQFSHFSSFTIPVVVSAFSSLYYVPVFSLGSLLLLWRWRQQVSPKYWKYTVSHARSLILSAVTNKMLKGNLELLAERMSCDFIYYNPIVISVMAPCDSVGGNSP